VNFFSVLAVVAFLLTGHATAQSPRVRKVEPVALPVLVDSNSPAYWWEGQFHIIQSSGVSLLATGANQFFLHQGEVTPVVTEPWENQPMWIESTWVDGNGTVWAWYHHEPSVCPNGLTVPEIGALVSIDGGRSFTDLGIVLVSGDPADCDSKNGFFAGGHGDFSVIFDEDSGYFYFLFTNYGGELASQGVAMARIAIDHLPDPAGAVFKYHQGEWTSPGLGGPVTPVFPAKVSWQSERTDSHWGPSVHWNYYRNSYVLLMSRACCAPRWPQEGVYISFSTDLSQPEAWSAPSRILSAAEIGYTPGWYPQVLGMNFGDTDTLAGQTARLYIKGISQWEIEF